MWTEQLRYGPGKPLFEAVPVVYQWNEDSGIYERTTEAPLPETEVTRQEADVVFDSTAYRAIQAMQNDDVATVLVFSMILQSLIRDVDLQDRYYGMYLTASAFEFAGRSEEALELYAEVQRDAPESAWSMLAGLHLEADGI